MAAAERMSAVDTTWLRMDRPANPMVILGIFVLDGPIDADRLEKTLADRLLGHRRFRQRAEIRRGAAWWVDDPYFDVSRHILRVRLPGRGGEAELETFVGALAATPLDRAIPLWQFHVVEGFAGGAAVVVRIHHAIGDGIALIGVMLSLTDELHGDDEPSGHWSDHADAAHAEGWREIVAPALDAGVRALGLGRKLLATTRELTRPERALDLARTGLGVAGELAGLLFMSNDGATSLKGVPHGAKRVAWADPLPLAEVKAVAHALDASVNDVLMSCVAGAIHRYMVERGEPTKGVDLRALIPVNLRSPAHRGELGNAFGIVTLLLPVGIDDPLKRLAVVRRRMTALKTSKQAGVTYGLLGALGHAPKLVQDRLFDVLLSRATAVMTNVPGPQTAMTIAGSTLSRVMFWVPQSGDIGIGVSVLSYAGNVQFGLITDAALVPDPRAVIAEFGPEFERLLYRTLLEQADLGAPAAPPTATLPTATNAVAAPPVAADDAVETNEPVKRPRRRRPVVAATPPAPAPVVAPVPASTETERPRRRRPPVEAAPAPVARPSTPHRRPTRRRGRA